MERLTERFYGWVMRKGCHGPCRTCTRAECADIYPMIDRLAAYEDTGLEPEEITTADYGCVFYCNRKCNLDGDFCTEGPGCPRETDAETAKHLLELAQAEKDGRLVVLPCKLGDLLYEVDLPKYGVITCKVLEIHTYFGPLGHAKGNPIVSNATVSAEVVEGHGKGSGYIFETLDFGENIFLTREEAEAAMKKREAGNEAD